MKRFFLFGLSVIGLLLFSSPQVGAESLKIAPLKFEDTLTEGETKKGFVDISNPSYKSATVNLRVQAFRQIDNDGSLEFYDDEQVASGVQLDLTKITLQPRGAMRIYFLLDSSKLPNGNVFAAILASTTPSEGSGTTQAVQVGTLLMLTNGTPVAYTADVTTITGSWLQVGDGITSTFELFNPADEKSYTGFFPEITVQTQPYGEKVVSGPLLFAGRTRSVEYSQQGSYFGPIRIVASAGGEQASRWIIAVTGYWRWLAPLLLVLLVVVVVIVRNYLLGRRSSTSLRRRR